MTNLSTQQNPLATANTAIVNFCYMGGVIR